MLPPRAGHSTVSFGKNLFVFGGFTDAQNLYDDLYMLDVGTCFVISIIFSSVFQIISFSSLSKVYRHVEFISSNSESRVPKSWASMY